MIITGYYTKCNLGDDIFEKYLSNLLNCETCTLDRLKNEPYHDIIIFGGGDLFTEYFLNCYEKYIEKKPNPKPKLIVIGCGIPYLDNLETWNKYVNELFIRHPIEKNTFSCDTKIISDLAFIALKPPIYRTIYKEQSKIVGVFPARPLISSSHYNNVVINIAKTLDYLIDKYDIKVKLIAFNTNKRKSWECDILMNQEIYSFMRNKGAVLEYDATLNIFEMEEAYRTIDYAICMRFHSHVFAIRHNVPFLSVHKTPKVEYLLQEIKYEKLTIDMNDVKFDASKELKKKWEELMENTINIRDNFKKYTIEKYKKKEEIEEEIVNTVNKYINDERK